MSVISTIRPAPLNGDMAPTPGAPCGTSKVEKFGWKVQDQPGELHWLDKKLLCIDGAYQRERVSESRIIKIAKNWSWVGCGSLIVGKRPDGLFVIIDGQHRWMAACKRSDIAKLPCIVFEVTGVKEEAQGFVNANVIRGPITSYESFRASLAAEAPAAKAVDDMVKSTGYRIANASGQATVCCVATLCQWHARNPKLTERIWNLSCEVAGGEHINTHLFGGLAFIENLLIRTKSQQSLTDRHNVETLKRLGQSSILQAAVRAKAYHGRGGERVVAEGIIDLMNKGRKSRRIPSTIPVSSEIEE